MSDFEKPDAVEEEIFIDSDKVIMCKTDKEGVFEFANESFMKISGYEEYELMGKSMYCIQHPDMPEVVFKMMWEKLLSKKKFSVIMKNIAKNGKFYWSYTNFDFKIDDNGEILAIYSKRIAASRESVTFFNKLYKTLVRIEKENGIESSEKYLSGFLEEKQMNFKELVSSFYDNSRKILDTTISSIAKRPTIPEKKIVKKEPEVIKEVKENILPKAEIINKKVKPTIKVDTKQKEEPKSPEKENHKKADKSLFQRLFGKTDEEIEEEKRRRENG